MSITDELRNYTEEQIKWLDMTKVHYRNLLAIADRIDVEHERAVTAAHSNGITEYGSMVAREYVKLPVDEDGEPIRVGDVMESKGNDLLFGEASFEVRTMRYDEYGWEVYDRLGDSYAPSLLCHYHVTTVEDVLDEFASAYDRIGGADEEHQLYLNLIAEYAKRLTLAEGEDE